MMLDVVGWNVTWFVVKWLAEEKTCSWHLQPSVPCLGSVWRFMANFRIQCMLLNGHSLCFLPGCNCDFLPVLAEYQSATIEPRNHATKQNSSSTTWVCWSDMSEITSAKFKLPQCHREIKKFVEVLTGSCCLGINLYLWPGHTVVDARRVCGHLGASGCWSVCLRPFLALYFCS